MLTAEWEAPRKAAGDARQCGGGRSVPGEGRGSAAAGGNGTPVRSPGRAGGRGGKGRTSRFSPACASLLPPAGLSRGCVWERVRGECHCQATDASSPRHPLCTARRCGAQPRCGRVRLPRPSPVLLFPHIPLFISLLSGFPLPPG